MLQNTAAPLVVVLVACFHRELSVTFSWSVSTAHAELRTVAENMINCCQVVREREREREMETEVAFPVNLLKHPVMLKATAGFEFLLIWAHITRVQVKKSQRDKVSETATTFRFNCVKAFSLNGRRERRKCLNTGKAEQTCVIHSKTLSNTLQVLPTNSGFNYIFCKELGK